MTPKFIMPGLDPGILFTVMPWWHDEHISADAYGCSKSLIGSKFRTRSRQEM
jgi:hypothetical protein